MKTWIVLIAVLWAGTGWADSPVCSDTATARQCITTLDDGSTIVTDSSWGLWSGSESTEATLPQYTAAGALKITKESLDALLKDNPDASLKVAVYEYDEHREVWDRARPAPCLDRMESAMRAMERYREREDAWATISDATSTITWNGPFTPAPMPMCCDYPLQTEPPPPPPTLEEKIEALEQETTRKIRAMKQAAAEAEEARGQRIVNDAHRKWAYQEWDAVKRECWK